MDFILGTLADVFSGGLFSVLVGIKEAFGIGSALYEAFFQNRKEKQRARPVLQLVTTQDPVEAKHEREVKAIQVGLAGGTTSPEAAKTQLEAVLKSAQARDLQIEQQLKQMETAQDAWQGDVKSMRHLSIPHRELIRKREAARRALMPYPEINPRQWRYVVVIGPAGQGKSSFIRNQLERRGYPELAELVRVSSMGTGTWTTPKPYLMTREKVLLLDSVGDAATQDMLEVIAADVLVVFLAGGGRGEQVHGDATVLAWRLRERMHTLIMQPRADELLYRSRRGKSVEEALHCFKVTAGVELHRQLMRVRDRAQEHKVALAPDVDQFLSQATEQDKDTWAAAMLLERWVGFQCVFCDKDYSCTPPEPLVCRADEEKPLKRERKAIETAMYGCSMCANVRDRGVEPSEQTRAVEMMLMCILQNQSESNKAVLYMQAWVQLLRSTDTEVQQNATSGLSRLLADNDDNRDLLMSAGIIPPLVQLLHSTDVVVQQRAALVLIRLNHTIANQVAFASAGAIPPLVQLLRSTALDVPSIAASALGSLALNGANQVAIASAGAIPPLVELLRSAALSSAATALEHLANNDANRVAIASAGAIPLLEPMLRSTDPYVRFCAEQLLGRLK